MARPLRIEYPGAYYHVMNRGLNRQSVFTDDKDRGNFLDLIGEIHRLWKVEIYAYCLMGNHYHLLLQTPLGNLSRVMRHLDGIYTQKYNRFHHRDGPLFRGRYKAILIDADEYLLSVARYIHHNPSQAGIVSAIGNYRWSSHRGYLNYRKAPKWLNTEEILSILGRGSSGIEQYKKYMHSAVEKEIKEYYSRQYFRPILGTKEFAQWVVEKLGDQAKVDREKPESRQIFGVELEQILKATAKYYGKTLGDFRKKRRGEYNEARMMAVYLCRQLGGYRLTEIGKAVGLENPSSVGTAYLKMKTRVEEQRAVARRARKISRLVVKSQKRI